MNKKIDPKTVESFGREWSTYNQSNVEEELFSVYENYFRVFPWDMINNMSVGFDMGCGSGRWANFVSSKVRILHCIDPSAKALEVAKQNLKEKKNCIFELGDAQNSSLKKNSMDFGYSLGVLHHTPDTQSALTSCVEKLKKKAPFLLYLYYDFENRPFLFKLLWMLSDLMRKGICWMPFPIKKTVCDLIAFSIYFPLSRFSRFLSWLGVETDFMPLSFYKDKSMYTIRTDSLDRFGTPLEKRFSKESIREMMIDAGLENIEFSEEEPYWVSLGTKK